VEDQVQKPKWDGLSSASRTEDNAHPDTVHYDGIGDQSVFCFFVGLSEPQGKARILFVPDKAQAPKHQPRFVKLWSKSEASRPNNSVSDLCRRNPRIRIRDSVPRDLVTRKHLNFTHRAYHHRQILLKSPSQHPPCRSPQKKSCAGCSGR
jgi:hypothetical protein